MLPFDLTLVDLNPAVVDAWRRAFARCPEISIVHGSMLDQKVDAWVAPSNAWGEMNGGLDAAIKHHLGARVEARLQAAIATTYDGVVPLGHAVCAPTDHEHPRFVISTPTMTKASENISQTKNPAMATAAALLAARRQCVERPASLRSIALAGFGVGTGQVPPDLCAWLMREAYELSRKPMFDGFPHMLRALEHHIGALDAPPKWPLH